MSRSIDIQRRYYQNQSGGSPEVIAWCMAFHDGKLDDFIVVENGHITGLVDTTPLETTPEDVAAFLADPQALAKLKTINLPTPPGHDAPIGLRDNHHLKGERRHKASAVGLLIDGYRHAWEQPLPLGSLDAQDRHLRRLQAAWVRVLDDLCKHLMQDVYSRNRQHQIWIIATTALTSLAAVATSILAEPAWGLGVALALTTGSAVFAQALTMDSARRNAEDIERTCHKIERASTVAQSATDHRQEALIRLIQDMFHRIGHLRDDALEIELTEQTSAHVGLIFALHRLLAGNRECTRLHVRFVGMADEASALQKLDAALVRRRKPDILTALSFPRIRDRMTWLVLSGLVSVGAAGAGLMPGIASDPTAVLIAALAGLASHLFGGWKVLNLHRRTDILISDAKLEEITKAQAFARTKGTEQVRLELEFSRLSARLLVRLLREENKHH